MRTLFTYYRIFILVAVFAVLPGLMHAQTKQKLMRECDSLEAVALPQANGDKNQIAKIYMDLAYKYFKLKNFEKSVSSARLAAQNANDVDNLDVQLEAFLHMGDRNVDMFNPVDAIQSYLAARNVIEKKLKKVTDPAAVRNLEKTDAYVLNQIGNVYFNLTHYPRALDCFLEALDEYKKLGDEPSTIQVTQYISISYFKLGDYDQSLKYYEQLLELYKKNNDWTNTKSIYQRIGEIYYSQQKYDKLYNLNKELYDSTCRKDALKEQWNALNNYAFACVCVGEYDKAISLYQQMEQREPEKASSEEEAEASLATTYTNLGLCYQNKGNLDECTKYLRKAIDLHRRHDREKEAAKVENLLAHIYKLNGDLHNADYYQKEAVKDAEKAGDTDLLIDVYKNYNEILRLRNNADSAIAYFQKALAIEKQIQDEAELKKRNKTEELKTLTDAEKQYTEVLANNDIQKLDQQNILLMQEQLRAANLREQLEKERNELLEKEARNLVEQARLNQLAIARLNEALALAHERDSIRVLEEAQKLELQESQDEIKRQQEEAEAQRIAQQQKQERMYYYFALAGLVLLFLLGFILSMRSKNKKLKAQQAEIELKNADLIQKNEEITQQKENLQAANNEILTKNEELSRQKEIIEAANKSITDSIVYAKRIQTAVCPSPKFLQMYNFEYFLFFRPRDIVSGDYYWFYADDYNHIFMCAADCTGHGVPGAFMSMLGLSLFNKIVAERNILEPGEILNHLRNEVKLALHQDSIEASQKDGMDLSLVRYDVDTKMLHFAAANNNGYLVQHFGKDEEEKAKANLIKPDHLRETEDGYLRLTIMPADSMPIGVYIREKESFTQTSYQLKDGDSFYLTSDGYIDQFGGKWGRKFLTKNFQKLVMDINGHDMKTQEQIVINTHEEWIGSEYDQLDDIIVIGVRV